MQAVRSWLVAITIIVCSSKASEAFWRSSSADQTVFSSVNVLSDVTSTKPLGEQFILYDVISDAPARDVKSSLTSACVVIKLSFQVIGTSRYFFVVVDDGADDKQTIAFPKGSAVTQYPLQRQKDFLAMFNHFTDWDDTQAPLVPGKTLFLCIQDILSPAGSSQRDLSQTMRNFLAVNGGAMQTLKPHSYAVIGRYPPRMYYFVNLEANCLQRALFDGLDAIGGPSTTRFDVMRIHVI